MLAWLFVDYSIGQYPFTGMSIYRTSRIICVSSFLLVSLASVTALDTLSVSMWLLLDNNGMELDSVFEFK